MIIHQSNDQDTRSFYTYLENTHYHMKKIDTYAAKVPVKLQNLDRRTMFREYILLTLKRSHSQRNISFLV